MSTNTSSESSFGGSHRLAKHSILVDGKPTPKYGYNICAKTTFSGGVNNVTITLHNVNINPIRANPDNEKKRYILSTSGDNGVQNASLALYEYFPGNGKSSSFMLSIRGQAEPIRDPQMIKYLSDGEHLNALTLETHGNPGHLDAPQVILRAIPSDRSKKIATARVNPSLPPTKKSISFLDDNAKVKIGAPDTNTLPIRMELDGMTITINNNSSSKRLSFQAGRWKHSSHTYQEEKDLNWVKTQYNTFHGKVYTIQTIRHTSNKEDSTRPIRAMVEEGSSNEQLQKENSSSFLNVFCNNNATDKTNENETKDTKSNSYAAVVGVLILISFIICIVQISSISSSFSTKPLHDHSDGPLRGEIPK